LASHRDWQGYEGQKKVTLPDSNHLDFGHTDAVINVIKNDGWSTILKDLCSMQYCAVVPEKPGNMCEGVAYAKLSRATISTGTGRRLDSSTDSSVVEDAALAAALADARWLDTLIVVLGDPDVEFIETDENTPSSPGAVWVFMTPSSQQHLVSLIQAGSSTLAPLQLIEVVLYPFNSTLNSTATALATYTAVNGTVFGGAIDLPASTALPLSPNLTVIIATVVGAFALALLVAVIVYILICRARSHAGAGPRHLACSSSGQVSGGGHGMLNFTPTGS
jgi:hypothetical protein